MDTRELPHDLEAERALLGAMLIDKNACNDVINMATPQDFYLDAHRLIFTGMKFLHDGNKPIDATPIVTGKRPDKIRFHACYRRN